MVFPEISLFGFFRIRSRSLFKKVAPLANVKLWNMFGAGAPLVRLCNIPGFDARSNDVVYCKPYDLKNVTSVVVYFGGDVQDFTENMKSHRDNKNYLRWNLENTALVLQKGFPTSHILVIKPSRMEYKTFTCYDNFVPCGNCGAPEHTPNHNALEHLEKVLHNVGVKLTSLTEAELKELAETSRGALVDDDNIHDASSGLDQSDWGNKIVDLDTCDIIIVGFSKGCVVLNQLIYEFHYLKTLTPENNTKVSDTVARIKEMFWLDGGHSGGKNTWITSRPLLETFSRLGIKVHIHVTPYQIQDERRPWIKKEEKSFHENLKQLGVPLERVLHFENVFPNLNLHFDVLKLFRSKTDQ